MRSFITLFSAFIATGLLSPDNAFCQDRLVVSLTSISSNFTSRDFDSNGSQRAGYANVTFEHGDYGMTVNGTYVSTSYNVDQAEGDFSVATFADTDITTWRRAEIGALTIQGGIDFRLPTGKSSYDDRELAALFVDDLSQDLQTVNSYGGGTNIMPHFMAIYEFSKQFSFGAGARYEMTGEYDPKSSEDSGLYNPGDRLTLVGNAVLEVSDGNFLLLTGSMLSMGRDTFGGEDVYSQGDVADLEFRYIGIMGHGLTLVGSARYQTQDRDEVLNEENYLASETANRNNNSLELFASAIYQYSPKFAFTLMAGFKDVGANGYVDGDSFYDAGRDKKYVSPGLKWYFGKSAYLSANFRYDLVKDRKDAFSDTSATYDVYRFDVGVVFAM